MYCAPQKHFTYVCKDINEYRELKNEQMQGWFVIFVFVLVALLLVKWIIS